jgi:2-dehydropantoate 2-reductase
VSWTARPASLNPYPNLTFNPITALTHATLVDICQDPFGRELAATMMTEAQSVAEKLGITFRVSLEKRIDGAERVGKHKTSMLQDVEAGKALETEAIIGAVVELGELTETPTPTIRAIYQAVKLLNRTLAEEAVRIRAEPVIEDAPASVLIKPAAAAAGR